MPKKPTNGSPANSASPTIIVSLGEPKSKVQSPNFEWPSSAFGIWHLKFERRSLSAPMGRTQGSTQSSPSNRIHEKFVPKEIPYQPGHHGQCFACVPGDRVVVQPRLESQLFHHEQSDIDRPLPD